MDVNLQNLRAHSKLILFTYEYLSETPLKVYQTLSHSLCGPKNCFKIFVIFSTDPPTMKILIKTQRKLGIISPIRCIIGEISPSLKLLYKKATDLSKFIQVDEITFDFDMEYHKYLVKHGLPVQLSENYTWPNNMEYVEAKRMRIKLIKAKYDTKIAKYEKKLSKESEKLPKILDREQFLLKQTAQIGIPEKKEAYDSGNLMQQIEELHKQLSELKSIISTQLTTKD